MPTIDVERHYIDKVVDVSHKARIARMVARLKPIGVAKG